MTSSPLNLLVFEPYNQ